MQEMEQYFKSVEDSGSEPQRNGAVQTEADPSEPQATEETPPSTGPPSHTPLPDPTSVPQDTLLPDFEPTDEPPTTAPTSTGRPIIVFAPPSSTTPLAAQTAYNPTDYVPTVDHAKQHQARLAASTANRRLPSDAELAARKAAQDSKIAAVSEVEIKVRFPDQSSAVARFGREDPATVLYAHVRSMLARETEPFRLTRAGAGGTVDVPENESRLIADLGLAGKVLVTVVWAEGASVEARSGEVLKPEVANIARRIEVKEPEMVDVKEGGVPTVREDKGGPGKGKGKGLPKWLKMPGKK